LLFQEHQPAARTAAWRTAAWHTAAWHTAAWHTAAWHTAAWRGGYALPQNGDFGEVACRLEPQQHGIHPAPSVGRNEFAPRSRLEAAKSAT
jgi:hypothetical protein